VETACVAYHLVRYPSSVRFVDASLVHSEGWIEILGEVPYREEGRSSWEIACLPEARLVARDPYWVPCLDLPYWGPSCNSCFGSGGASFCHIQEVAVFDLASAWDVVAVVVIAFASSFVGSCAASFDPSLGHWAHLGPYPFDPGASCPYYWPGPFASVVASSFAVVVELA